MRKLSEEEIEKYIKARNPSTGVDAITRERLESLDLDTVPTEVAKFRDTVTGEPGILFSDGLAYKRDSFIPRSGSTYFKPAFAGRQMLLGVLKSGTLLFSDGVWFSTAAPKHLRGGGDVQ